MGRAGDCDGALTPRTPMDTLVAGTDPRGEPVLISLVIPVFNEEATLDMLFSSLRDRLDALRRRLEGDTSIPELEGTS